MTEHQEDIVAMIMFVIFVVLALIFMGTNTLG